MSACWLTASACKRKQKGKSKTEKRGRKGLSSERNTRAQGGQRVCKKNKKKCVWRVYFRRHVQTVPVTLPSLSSVYTDRVLWFQPDEQAAQLGPHTGTSPHIPSSVFLGQPPPPPLPPTLVCPRCTTSTVYRLST